MLGITVFLLLTANPRGAIDLGPAGANVVRSMVTDGTTVYVTSDSPCDATAPTVFGIDVSNPSNLVLKASGGAGGCKANALAVADGRLYVASWASLLRTFDLGAAQPLVTAGELAPAHKFGWQVLLANGRAFVGHGSETESGFFIIDIDDPNNPRIVSDLTLPERLTSISAVRGAFAYLTRGNLIGVANVSDETRPTLLFERDLGHLNASWRLRGDYAYLAWADITSPQEGGVIVYDISDPAEPTEVGSWSGIQSRDIVLLGDLAFMPSVGNGVTVLDIANPLQPHAVDVVDFAGEGEIAVSAAGRFLYVGTANATSGLVHAVEVLADEPDDEGPTAYSGFSPTQTSWDFQLEGDVLPSAAGWSVLEGSEGLATVQDSALRVLDDGASKLKWAHGWNATHSRGGTALVRARCVSADANAHPANLTVEDGVHIEEVSILPDRVRLTNAGLEAALDGTRWHTYRVTTREGRVSLYVDEQSPALLTAMMTAASGRSRIVFGSGSSATKQEIWFDQVAAFASDRGPAASVATPSPAVSATVSDVGGKGTATGVDPATAALLWSTNGGRGWRASRWDERFEADALPPWPLAEGSASLATASAGELHVVDASSAAGSKVKWARAWRASGRGETVLARAKCASAGADTSLTSNLFVDDGAQSATLRILPDGVSLLGTGAQAPLDGSAWHTYRLTLRPGRVEVFVDDARVLDAVPVATTENRVMFGSGSSAGTQDITFDFVRFSTLGAFGPGEGPVEPELAVQFSGTTISAAAVPLDYTLTENRVQFALRDVVGNLGFSPAYVVQVTGTRPPGPDGGPGVDGGADDGGTVTVTPDGGMHLDPGPGGGTVTGCSCASAAGPLTVLLLALALLRRARGSLS